MHISIWEYGGRIESILFYKDLITMIKALVCLDIKIILLFGDFNELEV